MRRARLVVLAGAQSWGRMTREGTSSCPRAEGTLRLPLAYDEREAPYALKAMARRTRPPAQPHRRGRATSPAYGRAPTTGSPSWEWASTSATWRTSRAASPARRSRAATSRCCSSPSASELIRMLEPDRTTPCQGDALRGKGSGLQGDSGTAAPLVRDAQGELRYEVRHFVMEEPWLGARHRAQRRGTGGHGPHGHRADRDRYAQVLDMAMVTAGALARA